MGSTMHVKCVFLSGFNLKLPNQITKSKHYLFIVLTDFGKVIVDKRLNNHVVTQKWEKVKTLDVEDVRST